MIVALLFAADLTVESIATDYNAPKDRCRDGTASSNAIIVCGVRKPNRYRIIPPDMKFDPAGDRPSVASQRSRWIAEGDTGIGSCGPVGPGGWTGCMQKGWRQGRQQRGWYQ